MCAGLRSEAEAILTIIVGPLWVDRRLLGELNVRRAILERPVIERIRAHRRSQPQTSMCETLKPSADAAFMGLDRAHRLIA